MIGLKTPFTAPGGYSSMNNVLLISSVIAGVILYVLVRKTTERIETTLGAVEPAYNDSLPDGSMSA